MSDSKEQPDIQFYQLIISLHAGTMQQLGKVTSPITGKIERNLQAAKSSINLLEMIQRKMKGNLEEGEEKLLETTLFELRMNYVDELKKDKESTKYTSEDSPAEDSANEPSEDDKTPNNASGDQKDEFST